MSAIPELIIPLRLDADETIAQLAKLRGKADDDLGATGRKADETKDKFGGMGRALEDAANYMKGFVALQTGLQAVHAVTGAIADDMKRVEANIQSATKAFIDYRKASIEFAAITGKGLTNKETVATIQQARDAGVAPTALADTRKSLLEEAGGVIGKNMSQETFNAVSAQLARFQQARRIPDADMAKLANPILSSATMDMTPDDIMAKVGNAFSPLENAKGKSSRLFGEVGQMVGEGMKLDEAVPLATALAERGSPGEVGTYARAMKRSVQDLHVKKKAEALGLTTDMDTLGAAEKLYQKAGAEGVDFDNQTKVGVWLANQGITETEGQTGFATTFQAMRSGVLNRAKESMKGDGLAKFNNVIKGFEDLDVGKGIIAENRAKASEMESGELFSKLEEYKDRAKEAYFKVDPETKQSRATTRSWGDTVRDLMTPDSVFGSGQEMEIRAEARNQLYADARAAGVQGEDMRGEEYRARTAPGRMQPKETDQKEMIDLLKRIDERLATANQQRGDQVKRPLATKLPGAAQ